MMKSQQRQEFRPAPRLGFWTERRPPRLRPWFRQGKGIFTGATWQPSAAESAWEPVTRNGPPSI